MNQQDNAKFIELLHKFPKIDHFCCDTYLAIGFDQCFTTCGVDLETAERAKADPKMKNSHFRLVLRFNRTLHSISVRKYRKTHFILAKFYCLFQISKLEARNVGQKRTRSARWRHVQRSELPTEKKRKCQCQMRGMKTKDDGDSYSIWCCLMRSHLR